MAPRRSLVVPDAVAPLPSLVAPPPPSPLVQQLRKDWRWAGISQFIWTFSDAFGLLDWDIEALEADLDQDEMSMMPDLIAKMLYALTYNRQINRDNAFEYLRKQYIKRDPDHLLLGTEEEPREWTTLGLSEKVQALWTLCEWQMADPARFRALLKGEEEAASWRIEPVGWDKEGNTYFLFDDNRLWVQRLRPAPPRPANEKKPSHKAKRGSNKRSRPDTENSPAKAATPRPKASHKKRVRAPSPDLTPPPPVAPAEDTPVSGHRRRAQVAFYGNPVSTVAALKRGGMAKTITPASGATRRSSRGGPAAAAPAPALETPSRPSAKTAPSSSSLSRGTRASRRTRDTGDEWQAIPAEWLEPEVVLSGRKSKRAGKKVEEEKVVEEVESELSSLTDEEAPVDSAETRTEDEPDEKVQEEDVAMDAEDAPMRDVESVPVEEAEVVDPGDAGGDPEVKVDEKDEVKADDLVEEKTTEDVEMKDESTEEKPAQEPKVEVEEETDEVKIAAKEAANVPEGFVEWEAVCITLYDWRTFPERFAKSRDPDEKNLYSLLVDTVGPTVIQALVAKEQERLRQEAINNRKRSSRIATKELAKEEIARREKAEREMEERMEKSRRDENSKMRQEATVISQEKAREERLKEREDRIAAREVAAAQKAEEEQKGKDKADRARIRRQRRREGEVVETSEESEAEGSTRPSNKRSRVSTPVVPPKATNGRKRSADEGWELNCEICRKTGWNLDDDNEDVVSCDDCGRWQHTGCHNKQDASEGRPPRNWDKVDFQCKECRRKAARKRQRVSHEPKGSPLASAPFQPNGHGHGHTNGIHPAVNFNTGNGHLAPRNGALPTGSLYQASYGPRPPPSVFQAPTTVQGHPQPHGQIPRARPPGYPVYPNQQAPQYPPGSNPYGQQQQGMQLPHQGYRPQLQTQPQPQLSYPPQQQQRPQSYSVPAGHSQMGHLPPGQQYAHYAQTAGPRTSVGTVPTQQPQHLLHPSLQQNGSPGLVRPGSGSGPSLPSQARPNGAGYSLPTPQSNSQTQSVVRPQHVHPSGISSQYAHAQQQSAHRHQSVSQHSGPSSQPGQIPPRESRAQSVPRPLGPHTHPQLGQPSHIPASSAPIPNGSMQVSSGAQGPSSGIAAIGVPSALPKVSPAPVNQAI